MRFVSSGRQTGTSEQRGHLGECSSGGVAAEFIRRDGVDDHFDQIELGNHAQYFAAEHDGTTMDRPTRNRLGRFLFSFRRRRKLPASGIHAFVLGRSALGVRAMNEDPLDMFVEKEPRAVDELVEHPRREEISDRRVRGSAHGKNRCG